MRRLRQKAGNEKDLMTSRIIFLFLILGLGRNILSAGDNMVQSQPPETWVKVTLCDLMKDHIHDGDRVMFHARVLDGQLHGILLKDDRCDKGLRMSASDSVRGQDDYNEFMRTLYSLRKKGSERTITADFYGRFVYRAAEPRLKWALDVEKISNIEVQ